MDGCISPFPSGSEEEDESTMDFGDRSESQNSESQHADSKWTAYLLEDSDSEEKPRISIYERIRLMDEKEEKMIAEIKARGFPKIPDDYVPEVVKKPTKEEQEAKYQAWLEKLARIKREKEAFIAEDKRRARIEYEKYAKIQKDNKTRDYYWKPDPLFALHLRDLGYSKIAVDKALFYVDNTSVQKALEYLRHNPNPTELTKEEVMAAGEEVLKRIRPVRPPNNQPFAENLAVEDNMEIENASQMLIGSETEGMPCELPTRRTDTVEEENKDGHKSARKIHKDARGLKRNYEGEAIKHVERKTYKGLELPVVQDIVPDYQMIFVVNTRLLMDSVTLSLEVGKVTAKIMEKMTCDTDDLKQIQEKWINAGSAMAMYKGVDNNHMYKLHEQIGGLGYINFLAERSRCHDLTPSPTVLGVFSSSKQLKRVVMVLKRM